LTCSVPDVTIQSGMARELSHGHGEGQKSFSDHARRLGQGRTFTENEVIDGYPVAKEQLGTRGALDIMVHPQLKHIRFDEDAEKNAQAKENIINSIFGGEIKDEQDKIGSGNDSPRLNDLRIRQEEYRREFVPPTEAEHTNEFFPSTDKRHIPKDRYSSFLPKGTEGRFTDQYRKHSA
jgi:hypothetical protein